MIPKPQKFTFSLANNNMPVIWNIHIYQPPSALTTVCQILLLRLFRHRIQIYYTHTVYTIEYEIAYIYIYEWILHWL